MSEFTNQGKHASLQEKAEEAARQLIYSWILHRPKQINHFEPESFPNHTLQDVAEGVLNGMINEDIYDIAGLVVYFADAPEEVKSELLECAQGFAPMPSDCSPLIERLNEYNLTRQIQLLEWDLSKAIDEGADTKLLREKLAEIEAGTIAGKGLSLSDLLITSSQLRDMPITQRPKVLGEWLREGDLGYLYAPRGHGKTWMAMLIGNAIAEAEPLGEWQKGELSRRVIYFDAEMNLPDVQERARLIGIESGNFIWLQNELIFQRMKRGLNIAEVSDQAAIAKMLGEGDVFIIDNLSTAASGMSENDNDAFDIIKGWLLELRGRKITVLIVHHAGRNGEMRGASRREDIAHWVISLKDDSGDGEKKAWLTHFKKCRNCQALEAPSLRWIIQTDEDQLTYACEKHSGPEAMFALIRDGIETATDLAEELSVTKGCISKWAKKLSGEGKIKISDRKYTMA